MIISSLSFDHDWPFFLFVLVLTVAAGWSSLRMSLEAERIHRALDTFYARAKIAGSPVELRAIRTELCAYHQKYCYLRHYGNHAREVLNYINGRLA